MQDFAAFFKTQTHQGVDFARHYVHGLLQARRDAKNIERMAEAVPDLTYHKTQQFISHSPWDHRPLMDAVALEADGLPGGGPHSHLILDDSAVAKKGAHSVGVARQYNGRLGKVDNCQIAVCASLAAGMTSTPVDVRLYLPKVWTDDPRRCRKAGVPEEEMCPRSKWELALQSVAHLRALGVRFRSVGLDSGYGSVPEFLHQLDAMGECFIAEVHCNANVWLECPWLHHESRRPGPPLKKARPSSASVQVDEWAVAQEGDAWRRLKVRDSDQGWVEVSYLVQRVWTCHEGVESLRWLLVWDNPDEPGGERRRHYALSNAAAHLDPRQLVKRGVQRGVIEQNFRDAKKELGMADYQVRGWLGWHHHMSLVFLAMLFVLREKMHHPVPAGQAAVSAGDVVFVLEHYLPRRGFGPAEKQQVVDMLIKRREQRTTDQTRRRAKTARERPALWPDEEVT